MDKSRADQRFRLGGGRLSHKCQGTPGARIFASIGTTSASPCPGLATPTRAVTAPSWCIPSIVMPHDRQALSPKSRSRLRPPPPCPQRPGPPVPGVRQDDLEAGARSRIGPRPCGAGKSRAGTSPRSLRDCLPSRGGDLHPEQLRRPTPRSLGSPVNTRWPSCTSLFLWRGNIGLPHSTKITAQQICKRRKRLGDGQTRGRRTGGGKL
jgi:hypothetical protein